MMDSKGAEQDLQKFLCILAVCLFSSFTAVAAPHVILEAVRPAGESRTAPVGTLCIWIPTFDPHHTRIEIHDARNQPLPHGLLQWSPGEPLRLWFATTDNRIRLRLFAESSSPFIHEAFALRPPPAGLVLETRSGVEGSVETVAEVRSGWDRATAIYGRDFVDQIYHGIHPFGPSTNLLSRFTGQLRIEAPGRYGFATFSRDASFLLINNRVIAEWPGRHDATDGLRAEFRGEIELASGLHTLEYYNALGEGDFLVAAAWRPPGSASFVVIPPEAFEPVARFSIDTLDGHHLPYPPFRIQCMDSVHAVAGGIALIRMGFRIENFPPHTQFQWTFHDGTRRVGPAAHHIFTQSGIAPVTIETLTESGVTSNVLFPVRVTPNWRQRKEFPQAVATEILEELDRRDPNTEHPADLARITAFLKGIPDRNRLNRWGTAVIARSASFEHAQNEVLYRMGFHFQHPEIRQLDVAREAWERLLANRLVPDTIHARSRLHLAGLLIHGFGEATEARRRLRSLEGLPLDSADRRLARIFEADAAVLLGDLDVAHDGYAAIGSVPTPGDTRHAVRARIRLETAQRFLRDREFDAVEQILRSVEWEYPLLRMGLETGLLMAEVQRGRGETQFALQTCRRLLMVSSGHPLRPRLLKLTAELARERSLLAEADAWERQLSEEFPYSVEMLGRNQP